ncbi:MAG: K(+)-transporting ATPase subunit C [Verrucomicrobiota bacterium]|nr:K(+)-transporting ATPase subunit C [Verrucomicrobiota bacterium]
MIFFRTLKPAALLLAVFTLLLGILYPLFMVGVGQIFFHREANGSLLLNATGKVIGSEWIAQNFTQPKYFHPRPSSAGDKGYDATSSSGSNLGPTSKKLIDTVTQRTAAYRSENNLRSDTLIPTDAVTASASGLDPHISVANALLQMPRIASARGLSQDQVKSLIHKYTEKRIFGFLGEPRINVLRINLTLDDVNYPALKDRVSGDLIK